MKLSLRSLLAPSLALSLSLSAPAVLADAAADKANAQNWKLFTHFTLVASPDKAKAYGEKLLAIDNDLDFLKAVESTKEKLPFEKLAKWAVNDDLKPVWEKLEKKYQQALIKRGDIVEQEETAAAQIRADIKQLGGTLRQQYLAIERLKLTGQYAAPYMLEALVDEDQSDLHPRLINAMIEVGKELSYPLAIALPHTDASTQVSLARVLGDIGYPEALPYLKIVSEGPADSNVKAACQAAFTRITEASSFDGTGSAADIFVRLGQAKYAAGTRGSELLGLDKKAKAGIVWRYSDASKNVQPIAVDPAVFADSLAMQNAASALALDKENANAVTLHLSANLRRENALGDKKDPGYQLEHPASFYLLVSGAPQQKKVLNLGLKDGDAALSLDAIQALANTTGNEVLLSGDKSSPILDALYFGDRRVRFTAAITLANAAPKKAFPGSISVVPVLGQAVRQSDQLNAIVVAPGGAETLNAAMENIDFKSVGDVDMDKANAKAVPTMPGVDLIVYSGDFEGFEAMHAVAKASGGLSIAPIVALVDDGVASAIKVNYPGVTIAAPLGDASSDEEADRLERLAKKAIKDNGGEPIGDDEAEGYAVAALGQLKTIAGHESIYNANDVMPVLIDALDDDRAKVAEGAAQVLELMKSDAAQQGLANAALGLAGKDGRVGGVQIAILDSLAESAKSFGNKLDREAIDKLIALVGEAKGGTALSAARALGALTERPTSDTSGFILSK